MLLCNCVRNSHAHFHSVLQPYVLLLARMVVLAPNQIPAHVLWDGVGVYAVKVCVCGWNISVRVHASVHKKKKQLV